MVFRCIVCKKLTFRRYLTEWLHSKCNGYISNMYMKENNVNSCYHLISIAWFKQKMIDQIIKTSISSDETIEKFEERFNRVVNK